MARFPLLTYLTSVNFLIFHFNLLAADPYYLFPFASYGKDPNFESSIALYGDAKFVDNGSSIQLTHSVSSSGGRVMYNKPIKLVQGNPGRMISFSNYFSFSMSPDNGAGLAFVMVPRAFNASAFVNRPFGLSLESKNVTFKIVAIEFDTLKDVEYGDLNENHVGIDVGGFVSVKVRNVSSVNIVLNAGKKLHSWIDYVASSKRLEVRLSQSRGEKPIDPLLSFPIDLSKMWSDKEVFVGLSSSNGNSSQTCFIYSWSFKVRRVPHWMHSQPLDPRTVANNEKSAGLHKKHDCVLKVLAAMIFGTACGALGAFIVLYLWTIFGSRRPVVPEDCSVHPDPEDFEYKKVKVVVDKAVEDGKP
uniref:Lectin-like protein At1g53070 n=1 Tax=Rhizophora mucronata TaxID=61149 RepID=A0A2P2JKW2_RHIMU